MGVGERSVLFDFKASGKIFRCIVRSSGEEGREMMAKSNELKDNNNASRQINK